MSKRGFGLADRLLVRAWIEPEHEQHLRVLVRTAPETQSERQRTFADADSAAAFIRDWLRALPERWAGGERMSALNMGEHPDRNNGSDDGRGGAR